MWLGYVQILTNRASRGIGELERALSLNRNLGQAHAWIGLAKITLGRAEETEGHVNEAFRISPSDGASFLWKHIDGMAKLHLGRDEEAADLFRRSIDASRNYPLNHFCNAAALAHLGRRSEAEGEVKAGLAMAPKFTLARFRGGAESDNPVYLAQRERVTEGMRAAGVPEQLTAAKFCDRTATALLFLVWHEGGQPPAVGVAGPEELRAISSRCSRGQWAGRILALIVGAPLAGQPGQCSHAPAMISLRKATWRANAALPPGSP